MGFGEEEPHSDDEDDDEIIEYMMDDDGYLLDRDGNYVLDDEQKPMRLNEQELETVKQNGLYEEVEKTMIDEN